MEEGDERQSSWAGAVDVGQGKFEKGWRESPESRGKTRPCHQLN